MRLSLPVLSALLAQGIAALVLEERPAPLSALPAEGQANA